MKLHPKIQELKRRAAPITYSSTTVDRNGNIESLLDKRQVEGYAFIWGSKNMHGERFFKGAFARSIRENGPNSGASYELKLTDEHGRALALFEELKEDETGLYFRSKPFDVVPWAEPVLTQLRSGTLNNFSGGFLYVFEPNAIMWNEQEESLDIFQARLLEIAVVAVPSEMETYALRSMDSEEEELLYEETESFIKSLPKKNQLELRKLIARHKSLAQGDASEQIQALKDEKPVKRRAIDYNYLTQNFSLK
jgi:HK97 family phage prohead protease